MVHRVEYGSILRSFQREGIGDVIGNWNGNVVRKFLGPMDSSDANEAEAFALLIECRELVRIGGSHPLIDGDAFSAIIRALGRPLILGILWIVWRRCRICQEIWVLLFFIFQGRLIQWRMVLPSIIFYV